MEISWVPLISGLVGAIIGAGASVATILISSYFENRRQLNRLAYEAAIEDCRTAYDLAKRDNRKVDVAPLTSYIHFHVEHMRLLEGGKLTADKIDQLKKERDQLYPTPK